MVRRSRTRQLLLFGTAVALVAHLWMLHDPMPAASAQMTVAESAPAMVGGLEPLPPPSGDQHGSEMQFMALTCFAVLVAAAAVWLGAGAWRSNASGLRSRPGGLPPPRRLGAVRWRPPPAPPSRVDAGVLLLV